MARERASGWLEEAILEQREDTVEEAEGSDE